MDWGFEVCGPSKAGSGQVRHRERNLVSPAQLTSDHDQAEGGAITADDDDTLARVWPARQQHDDDACIPRISLGSS